MLASVRDWGECEGMERFIKEIGWEVADVREARKDIPTRFHSTLQLS
jgi:hypothetical protein